MDNYSGPPYDPEQIQRLRLEAAFDTEEPSLIPERTFDAPKPPPLITWQGQMIACAGSLVLIGGQAKHGKSTLLLGFAKSFVSGVRSVCDMNELEVNSDIGGLLMWFDTEQARWKVHQNMKYVCGTNECPPNLEVYCLKTQLIPQTRDEIFRLIDEKKPTIAILDGLSEFLVKGINDIAESNDTIIKLMALAERTGTCILCVLHDNQGASGENADKARGHLGSELERKCDSSIVCKRIDDAIVLRVRQIRNGRLPDKLHILFSEKGEPYGGGVYEENSGNLNLKVRKTAKALIKTFGGQTVSHKDLLDAIMNQEGVSDGTAKTRIKHLVEEGFIVKVLKNGKASGYTVPAE